MLTCYCQYFYYVLFSLTFLIFLAPTIARSELKRESTYLNIETRKLNEAVGQTKVMADWLAIRRRKVSELRKHFTKLQVGIEEDAYTLCTSTTLTVVFFLFI